MKILYALLATLTCATRFAHYNLLDVIILMFSKEYNRHSTLCCLLHPRFRVKNQLLKYLLSYFMQSHSCTLKKQFMTFITRYNFTCSIHDTVHNKPLIIQCTVHKLLSLRGPLDFNTITWSTPPNVLWTSVNNIYKTLCLLNWALT